MVLASIKKIFPPWKSVLPAVIAAVLLILAFPDFDYWFLAFIALVPLMWAVNRERKSTVKTFFLGWIFGNIFFFGTCWWLAFAPIKYAAFPPTLAYFLLFCVTSVAAIFPGLFAATLSGLLKRFGSIAILAAPFVWVFTEFLRYWVTGNNWNAIGYSQAFVPDWVDLVVPFTTPLASVGGISLVGFVPVVTSSVGLYLWLSKRMYSAILIFTVLVIVANVSLIWGFRLPYAKWKEPPDIVGTVIALQPNVPMSGLTDKKWLELRLSHVRLAESALAKVDERQATKNEPVTVIFPESPMNFMYEEDSETKSFIDLFAANHNVSVLFNSAEPDRLNGKLHNSAVMVDAQGRKVAQYDKIYLLPFGEAVPVPFESFVPAFVGSFSFGKEYDLLPLGDAKAGIMICFESHFGQLSREYVRSGADVIIEMTNDGYLGPTPVLRQHLANAVFRAVETNRPVLRVTNVGITTYINERGEVLDPAASYTEDTRQWSVAKSDRSQTFYVQYGDWFAWLCTLMTMGLLGFCFFRYRSQITDARYAD